MREAICQALLRQAEEEDFIFLTGDLGFMALEPLRDKLGERFINAGVAEQNMVSVAAALCSRGWKPWVYSIAPFLYARAFEQIRNDVALHQLPVKLIGNGGGYGYGVMGPTHHSLEDYGVLSTLSNFEIHVPSFDQDVSRVIELAAQSNYPVYIRLGRDDSPETFSPPPYAGWRRLRKGSAAILIVSVGPISGTFLDEKRPRGIYEDWTHWTLSTLPVLPGSFPTELMSDIKKSQVVVFVEEHVQIGGAGSQIVSALSVEGVRLPKIIFACAKQNHSGLYGSQNYLRRVSQISPEDVSSLIEAALT
jgi:transketolase